MKRAIPLILALLATPAAAGIPCPTFPCDPAWVQQFAIPPYMMPAPYPYAPYVVEVPVPVPFYVPVPVEVPMSAPAYAGDWVWDAFAGWVWAWNPNGCLFWNGYAWGRRC